MNETVFAPALELHELIFPLLAVVPRMLGFMLGLQLLTVPAFPALVRNGIAIAISLVAYPLAASDAALQPAGYLVTALIIIKEGLLGFVLGYLLGLPLSVFESFGSQVDTQAGMNSAAIFDPQSGHELGPSGMFLRNFATTLFLTLGVFGGTVEIALWSYKVWPVAAAMPPIFDSGATPFLPLMTLFVNKVVLIAFPVILVLVALELSVGLINRVLPQLNVFTVTMPLKVTVAVFILIVQITVSLDYIAELLRFPQAAVRRWLGF